MYNIEIIKTYIKYYYESLNDNLNTILNIYDYNNKFYLKLSIEYSCSCLFTIKKINKRFIYYNNNYNSFSNGLNINNYNKIKNYDNNISLKYMLSDPNGYLTYNFDLKITKIEITKRICNNMFFIYYRNHYIYENNGINKHTYYIHNKYTKEYILYHFNYYIIIYNDHVKNDLRNFMYKYKNKLNDLNGLNDLFKLSNKLFNKSLLLFI